MRKRAVTIAVEGPMYPGGRREEQFTSVPIVIGRADDCHVVIDRPSVARRHARIIERDGELCVVGETRRAVIRDRNGVPIPRAMATPLLSMGWTMRIGEVTVVVSEESDGATELGISGMQYSMRRTEAGTAYLHGTTTRGEDVEHAERRAGEAVLAKLRRPHDALVAAIAPLSVAFRAALLAEIEAVPIAKRRGLCQRVVARYPLVSVVPDLAATLEQLANHTS